MGEGDGWVYKVGSEIRLGTLLRAWGPVIDTPHPHRTAGYSCFVYLRPFTLGILEFTGLGYVDGRLRLAG